MIRSIDGIDDVRAAEELQKEVWGIDDRDVTPLTQLVAAREVGGQLLGAYDGPTLVGFLFGFLGLEHGRVTHHSHMLAVKPAYRNRQVGYELKLAQRERVLAQGITVITWTFDPLQSLNAHFNFGKLGVISRTYKVDFYGEMTSSFLHRMGTDRLWVIWHLDSSRVRCRLEGAPIVRKAQRQKLPLLEIDPSNEPRENDPLHALDGVDATIEIPGDINLLQQHDPQLAVRWRMSTRRAFSEALASGFMVEDFFRHERGEQSLGVYVLSRGRSDEDFA